MAGVRRAPCGAALKFSLKLSKGSWGSRVKVVVSCPVLGSGVTLPASLTTIPVWGSSREM